MTCSVHGCALPVKWGGACSRHWWRRFRKGQCRKRNKLTPGKVRAMRRAHAWKVAKVKRLNELFGIEGIARRLGVSPQTVDRALRGETWKEA